MEFFEKFAELTPKMQEVVGIFGDFDEEQKNVIESLIESRIAEESVIGSTDELANSQNIAKLSSKSLGASLKGLFLTLASNPLVMVGVAVAGVVTAISIYKKKQEELRSSTEEASSAFADEKSSMDDYIAKYQELKQALEDAKGNEEETYRIKQDLLSLQTELNDKYGDEYGKINLVTDAYRDQTDTLKGLNKELAQQYLNDNVKGIEQAKKKMEKENDYHIAEAGLMANSQKGQILSDLVNKYADRGMYMDTSAEDGTISVKIKADATDAENTINSFMSDLRDAANKSGDSDLFKYSLETASKSLNKAKEIGQKYGETYNQALKAEIATDDTLSSIYSDAEKAVSNYNEAVLQSSDAYTDENVAEAYKQLKQSEEAYKNNTKACEEYGSVFDSVFKGASIGAYEFYKYIDDDKTGAKELVHTLSGLDDVDLKSMADDGSADTFDMLAEKANEYGLSVEDTISIIQKFNEVQKEVGASDTSISLETATTSVKGIRDEYELLTEILADVGNVSEETYDKLITCSSKYSSAVSKENGKVVVNTNKLRAVAKARQLNTKSAVKETLALKRMQWLMWAKNINVYKGQTLESVKANYENIDSLQEEITKYSILEQQLDSTSGAFERFKQAQETNDQDMYDTAKDAFDVLNQTLNDSSSDLYQKFNTDDFQAAFMEMADPETFKKAMDAGSLKEYKQVVSDFVKEIAPLYDENNINSASNLFDRINEILDSGDVPVADIDWANRLGISEAQLNALKQFGNEYGWNGNNPFESFSLDKGEEYYNLVTNLQTEEEALAEITDKTSTAYLAQKNAVDQAKKALDDFTNGNETTLDEMLEKFNTSGFEKTGGSFADFLKKNMGLEDSDIDGLISSFKGKLDELSSVSIWDNPEKYSETNTEILKLRSLLELLGYSFDEVGKSSDESAEKSKKKIDELIKKNERLNELLDKKKNNEFVNPEDVDRANQEIESIISELGSIPKEVIIQIKAEKEQLEADLAEVNGKLEAANNVPMQYKQYVQPEIDDLNKTRAQLEANIIELDAIINFDPSEVDNYEAPKKTMDIDANMAPADATAGAWNPPSKTMDVDAIIHYDGGGESAPGWKNYNPNDNPNGKYGYNGTAHFGNSYADGRIGTKTASKNTMVGEIAPEMVIDPRNATYTIYDRPSMIDLPKDAIVFNGKQTEEILKNGYTGSFGKSLVNGNADGKAFLDGGGMRANPIAFPQVKKSVDAAVGDLDDKIDKTKEDTKDAFEEIFDWIERRIKNFQTKFDRWIKQAESAISATSIARYYKNAKNELSNLLGTYSASIGRYNQQADASGLSEEYKQKVRDGLIDIETITDENLSDAIQKYQDYYDKSVEMLDNYIETAQKLYNIPIDKAAQKIERYEDAIDSLDKKLANLTKSSSKNKVVDEQTKEQKKILKAQETANKEAKKNLSSAAKSAKNGNLLDANDGISKSERKKIQSAIKDRKEINLNYYAEGSEGYKTAIKYNEALKARTQTTKDLKDAQQDYNRWLVEASKIKFDNIAKDFENNIKKIEFDIGDLENEINNIEAAGKRVGKSFYESQKAINSKELTQYNKEYEKLVAALPSIKEGTDEWYDAKQAIQDCKNNIASCTQETYKLNQAIVDLNFQIFEDTAKQIDRISSEYEFLQGLMAHEKTTDKDTGAFTDAGLAKLGTTSVDYYANVEKAAKSKRVVEELQDMVNKNIISTAKYPFNSIEELEAKLDEAYTTWQDDIKSTYAAEEKLADLMKEKYQAQLDLIKEMVDAKKESLRAEKDLHDYQRTINQKVNDIGTIQKQIIAYQGNSSQEGQAMVQRLQKQLYDKKDDLRETEYDRFISDQENMLDKLVSEYEDVISKKIDDFKELVGAALETANGNSSAIKEKIEAIAGENGYLQQYKNINEALNGEKDSIKNAITTECDKIYDKISGNVVEKKPEEQSQNPPASGNNKVDDKQKSNIVNTAQNVVNALQGSSIVGLVKPIASAAQNALNALNPKDEKTKAMQYIEKHLNKAQKEAKEYSDINQVLYKKNNKQILSTAELKELAKIVGVKYDNASKNGTLYKKLKSLKIPGFSRGGVISIDDINKVVSSNGDKVLMSGTPGERVLTESQNRMWEKWTESLPDLIKIAPVIGEMPNIQRNQNATSVGDVSFYFELPNVKDSNSLLKELQTDKNVQKAIQTIVINPMVGKSLQSVKHIN